MARSSEAMAEKVTGPVRVAPSVGAVTVTVGGTKSLLAVTVTGAEVVLLPAASTALAVTVRGPLGPLRLFHESEKGAEVSEPTRVEPS